MKIVERESIVNNLVQSLNDANQGKILQRQRTDDTGRKAVVTSTHGCRVSDVSCLVG